MLVFLDFVLFSFQILQDSVNFSLKSFPMLNSTLKLICDMEWKFIGLASSDLNKFRADLIEYWFGLYARHKNGPVGSSGFEHVYIGEYNKNEVDGLHNWIRYYSLESHDDINYFGHFVTDPVQQISSLLLEFHTNYRIISPGNV